MTPDDGPTADGPTHDGPTHDWSRSVDVAHLAAVRAEPDRYAPGGVGHLLLEVLGYAAEEAQVRGGGRCVIRLLADGSLSVADDGRGTQVRSDQGDVIRKPVMATPDLRFLERPDPVLLPDGHPRRGMSTVAALSRWLVHTNRRTEGCWTQRYEHGVPVTDLSPVPGDGSTGTTVHLLPDAALVPLPGPASAAWTSFAELLRTWPALHVELLDQRPD